MNKIQGFKFCSYCNDNHPLSKDFWVLDKRLSSISRFSRCKQKNKDTAIAYYYNNREKGKNNARKYWNRIKDIETVKQKKNSYAKVHKQQEYKRRYNIDELWTLKLRVRSLIRTKIKNGGYTIKSGVSKYLGSSYEEFRSYIELQFTEEMSWQNHGEVWHLDHICPCEQAVDAEELLKLQHFSNLRPLLKVDNLSKGARKTPAAVLKCRELLNRDWKY